MSETRTLRELRLATELTAKQLAAEITAFLGEVKMRDTMSVIMMERRGSMSNADVRDALEYVFGKYGIDAEEVRAACRK